MISNVYMRHAKVRLGRSWWRESLSRLSPFTVSAIVFFAVMAAIIFLPAVLHGIEVCNVVPLGR